MINFNRAIQHVSLLSCLVLCAVLKATAHAQDPFAVLAYVNQSPITAYDVQARAELLTVTGQVGVSKGSDASFRAEILADLIDETIQVDQAAQQGILPGQDAVETSFAQLAARNNLSPEEFEEVLRTRDIDPRLFKTQLLPQIAWNNVLRANANGRLGVSDEDLDARWSEIQAQAGRQEWLLTEIYLDGVTRATAEAAADSLRAAPDFIALVRDISDSPSAADGGDLGWMQEGTLGAAREAAIREINVGEISAPVASAGGYFIYGIRATRPVGASSVSTEVDLKRLTVPLTEGGESLEDQQRLGALETVLRQVNTCERFLQAAEIYGAEGSGDLGFVSLASLPPLHANAIAQLPTGRISPLLPIQGGGVVYIACDTRDIAQPLTKEEVRAEMAAERQQELSEELMLLYRRQAYIEYL